LHEKEHPEFPLLDQELISYGYSSVVLVLVLFGATSSKKAKAPSFQFGSGWNLARMFFT